MQIEHSARVNPNFLIFAAFGKWWMHLKPRHKWIIAIGFVFFLMGALDFIRLLVGYASILFWSNDLFLAISGLILIAAGISYALRN
jgi:energy-coupling factor transporter transmembrane protein EcfT